MKRNIGKRLLNYGKRTEAALRRRRRCVCKNLPSDALHRAGPELRRRRASAHRPGLPTPGNLADRFPAASRLPLPPPPATRGPAARPLAGAWGGGSGSRRRKAALDWGFQVKGQKATGRSRAGRAGGRGEGGGHIASSCTFYWKPAHPEEGPGGPDAANGRAGRAEVGAAAAPPPRPGPAGRL